MVKKVTSDRPELFRCEHISKQFHRQPVLNNINFSVNQGEFVSIVGPSGCGKTTLLRIIRGFIKPDDGAILFNDDWSQGQNEIGVIFQHINLLPWRTVTDNIRLPLELKNVPVAEIEARVANVLEITGLQGAESRYPYQLSGGMKQLAALAKALMNDDKLILMDEPFASLDPATREAMAKKLHRLWKETNTTILFVTHFIDEAVFMSDRVVLLSSRPATVKYIADTSSCNGGDYTSFRYPVSVAISQAMDTNGDLLVHDNDTLPVHNEKHPGASIKWAYALSPLIAVLLLLVWEGLVRANAYPEFILPSPAVVWQRFLDAGFSYLMYHLSVTAIEAICGFGLGAGIGLLLGYMLAKFPFLEKVVYPYITASQTTPIIAIAPLLALWFGFGMLSKVVVAALIVFFPVLVTTITSLREISSELSDLMRDLNASKWQTFLRLEIPGALPYLFATMKVAITLSLIGAVVGEFVSSNRGLGYLVIASKGVLDTPLLFVTIAALAVTGVSLYSFIMLLEKLVFRSKSGYVPYGN